MNVVLSTTKSSKAHVVESGHFCDKPDKLCNLIKIPKEAHQGWNYA